GKSHRVDVRETGFAWNGKLYTSLSEIARAITGTRWNGPRFFRLREGAVATIMPARRSRRPGVAQFTPANPRRKVWSRVLIHFMRSARRAPPTYCPRP